MSTEDFKSSILEYLSREKTFIERDIFAHQQMSEEEKVADGYLIQNAYVASKWGIDCYDINVSENNTRLRPGDRIILNGINSKIEARIIDNGIYNISIQCDSGLNIGEVYDLVVQEAYLLDPLHTVLESISAGSPGYSFLSQLSGETTVSAKGLFPIDPSSAQSSISTIDLDLDLDKTDFCLKISENPSIMCLQGPPGTGKTFGLAAAVNMLSQHNNQTLVIALTHQAVHNALNQIRAICPSAPIIKIGDSAKAQHLDKSIERFPTIRHYIDSLIKMTKTGKKKHTKPPQNLIVGMTFHAAIINFGLIHNKCIFPTYVFLDEASQIPLPYASVLGTFGAGSICLSGDSRQMPPIFHPELESDPLSQSILDYCTNLKNVPISVLHTTYRMNETITNYISKNFYENHGIKLNSSATAKDRQLILHCFNEISQAPISLITQKYTNSYTESNNEEADCVMEMVKSMINDGVDCKDIAIITPYRKQVCALRDVAKSTFGIGHGLLIDTVERLQGQDVDCIILSFAASDMAFINGCRDFIFNPNRLNVMISRAKKKVLIYASKGIAKELADLYPL